MTRLLNNPQVEVVGNLIINRPPPAEAEVFTEGGSVNFADGRIALELPPDWTEENEASVHFQLESQHQLDNNWGGAIGFSLEAVDGLDQSITEFQEPVTLTLSLDGLVDMSRVEKDSQFFLAYREEPTALEWTRVPVTVDREAGTISAATTHFSDWMGGANGPMNQGWALSYHEPTVSLFTGSAAYSYPIEVPAGRNGIQPDVSLNYSSSNVDGIVNWTQSDWAGLGWTVDSPQITRKVWQEFYNYGYDCTTPDPNTYVRCMKNKFNLILNGAAYDLIPANSAAGAGRYYTQPESFFYIVRCNDRTYGFANDTLDVCQQNNGTNQRWLNGKRHRRVLDC